MNVKVKITNLPQIRMAFGRAPGIMSVRLKEALAKSAFYIEGQSMIRTPVDTGRLRASHQVELRGFGLQMEAVVGPNTNYAVFVHEGTRFMRGRPFLKDAVEDGVGQIDRFFTDATQKALDDIGRMV